MVKISKRITVLIAVISAIIFIILVNGFLLFPGAFTFPEGSHGGSKARGFQLKIEPSYDWQSSNLKLSVTNTYDSPITAIGSKLNSVNFGYEKLEIPPGQTQDVILPLNNLAITNSTKYDSQLTFTFDDGKYQIYSESIITKKYAGSFIINGQSLNATSNSTNYTVTIQNTGNIPLVSLKYTIGNYESFASST